MGLRRILILLHPESLIHAQPTDLVVTDTWEVLDTAISIGVPCLDLRELLVGKEDFLDETVIAWRCTIDRAHSPEMQGVPILASLRAEILWGALSPFARYAVATQLLAGQGYEIVTDLRHPDPRRVGIEAILGKDAVIELPGNLDAKSVSRDVEQEPVLPASHGPVVVDTTHIDVKRNVRECLFFSFGKVATAIFDRLGKNISARPVLVYGHYRTLGAIGYELGKRYRLILWPWAYPRTKDALSITARGSHSASLFQHRNLSAVARPPSIQQLDSAIQADLGERAFFLEGTNVTPWLSSSIARVVVKYWKPLSSRIAAAKTAILQLGAECVLIPNDTSIDFAPLSLVATGASVPVIVVAHGLEGSQVLGDKRLASDVFVWSLPMAKYIEKVLGRGGTKTWVTGPPHLEGLARTRTPKRSAVLFLSYTVRHNTAWDSRLDAERYLCMLSEVLQKLGSRICPVGLKIHPSEHSDYYRWAMGRARLKIPIRDRGWVYDNLDDASVVVGPISTGLAEAFHLGSMPVCVNLSGGKLPAPCDGSTEIPVVCDAASLTDILAKWLDRSVWPNWTPQAWPAFFEFVGVAKGASRRAADAVGQVLRS
ncbi:MAG: hypothetical protein C4318_00555 [Acidimicrobiia bacterium]